MKVKIISILLLIVVIAVGCRYFSYVFSRRVSGVVTAIDRVVEPNMIVGGGMKIPSAQIFSFAVAIQEKSGEIVTASSEDRQWAVVEKGQCAEAIYFPYPPWALDKAGTFFGARLIRLFECSKMKD